MREAGNSDGLLVKTSCHSLGLEIRHQNYKGQSWESSLKLGGSKLSSGQLTKLEDPKIAPPAFRNKQSPIYAVSTWLEKLSLGCFVFYTAPNPIDVS